MTVARRLAWGLGAVGALAVALVAGVVALGIPRIATGMAAKAVCSAAFLAGRDPATLFPQDVRPADRVFALVNVAVDRSLRTVSADLAGFARRQAVWLPDRGCVLDVPRPAFVPVPPAAITPGAWPTGDLPEPESAWDPGIDAAALRRAVDTAFVGAGDPEAANTRAVAVVRSGRLLVLRTAPGFQAHTALHGWSMTKTIGGMLAYARARETGLDLATPVVDAFPADRQPAWVQAWRRDARARIRVSDLLFMRDGLANVEGYAPWSDVPRMLWGTPDVAAFGAAAGVEAQASARWRYSSATANILAAVVRGLFASDAQYWAYPREALFGPIGARTAALETDPAGNWVASSFGWASVGDWARVGELLRNDGRWGGRQVVPAGFLALAQTPAVDAGEGRAYGAQTWRIGESSFGDCRGRGLPEDTLALAGHWGQIVAVIPSRNAVIVRLGWTFRQEQFDTCRFVADVVAALR